MKTRPRFSLLLALVGALTLGSPLHATTFTWDGTGGDSNWNTGANWVGDPASGPTATGHDLIFDGTTQLTNINNIVTSANSITYNSGAGMFVSTATVASLTLAGNLTDNSTNTQTLNMPFLITGNARTVTVGSGGKMVFGSSGNTTYAHTINTSTGTNQTVFTGAGEVDYYGASLSVGTSTNSTVDMSGLSTFKLYATNFYVANNRTSTTTGNVKLAASNTLNVDNINIGFSSKAAAASTITVGSGSTVTIAPLAAAKTNIVIGKYETSAGSPNRTDKLDFTGGTVTANSIGTMTLGTEMQGNFTGGTVQGTFVLDGLTSSVTADTVNMGTFGGNYNNSGAVLIQGNLTIKGGTMTTGVLNVADRTNNSTLLNTSKGVVSVSGGTLTINTTFQLGKNAANTTTQDDAQLLITGGAVTSKADIATTTLATSTITLNGSTAILDMWNKKIGTAAAPITNLNWQSGTLKNVASINGTAGLTKTDTGTLTLEGTNGWTGATTISNGTLKAGAAGAIPNGTGKGNVVLDGGATAGILDLNGYDATINGLAGTTGTVLGQVLNNGSDNKVLTVGNAGATANFTGIIKDNSGTGGTVGLAQTGSGTLTLSGANSHTGGTTVTQGILSLGSAGALGSTGTISMNGGTLQFSASNTTDYTSGSRLKIEDGKIAVFDTNSQPVSFASALQTGILGNGGLRKDGNGTLTLSGANTYTGATTINTGTLKLTGGSLGNTAMDASSPSVTLAVQPGTATTINAGTTSVVGAGATLNLGSNTLDMIDGASCTFNLQQEATGPGTALTVTNGATFKFDLGNTTADQLNVTNAVSVSAGATVNVTLDTSGATALTTGTYNLISTAVAGLMTGGPTWQFTGGGTTQVVSVGGNLYSLTLDANDVLISVTVADATTPVITAAGTPGAVNTIYGTASSPTSFTVSGSNMFSGILVTAPAGFQVSLDSGSGYAGSITVGSGGTIAETTVYVRLSATAPVTGTYNGQNIVLTSPYAVSRNVATAESGNIVSKANSAVTPIVGTYTYNGSALGPNSVTRSGSTGVVTYEYAGTPNGGGSYGPDSTRPAAAGSYTVTATLAADDNFNGASSDPTAFLIAKATPTLSVTNTPVPYNGSPQAATVSGAPVAGTPSSILYNGSATVPSAADTYPITADFAPTDSNNYNSLTAEPAGNFVIQKLVVSLTGGRPYDGTTAADSTILSVGNKAGLDDVTVASGSATLTSPAVGLRSIASVGSLTLGGASANNYTLTGVGGSVTISQKPLSITAPSIASKAYNASASAGAVTVGTLSGFVSGETVTATATATDYSSANASSYPGTVITYTLHDGIPGPGLATNYSLANGSTAGEITQKPLTIGAPTIASKAYNASATAGAVTVAGDLAGFVGTETVTATGAAADYGSANAGSYPGVVVTYTLHDGTNGGLAANYSLPNGTAGGVINPLPVQLSGTRPFDTTATAIASILTVDNNLDGVNLTLSGSVTLADPAVGTQPISSFGGLTLGGSAKDNYTTAGASGSVVITSASDPYGNYVAGLPEGQRGAMDTPQNDGVANLLKYAFNLNVLAPDVRVLTPGATGETAGLPCVSYVAGKLRLEFLRRKASGNPGITYIPQISGTLGGWGDFTGDPTTVSIDDTWERVTIDDTVGGMKRFGRVQITQP